MKIVDLFCGAGGASEGLHQAFPKAEITGVDLYPQPDYPFTFIQDDALGFDVGGFDFIWASPPCQPYSVLAHLSNRTRKSRALIPQVRSKLQRSGLPYVIENVPQAPLEGFVTLCGSYFCLATPGGLQLRRHRIFECSFPAAGTPCSHAEQTVGIFGSKAKNTAKEKQHYSKPKESRGRPAGIKVSLADARKAMGIDWMGFKDLSQAIPPAYSRYLGKQLEAYLELEKECQDT